MTEIIGRVGWRNFAPANNPLWNKVVAYYTADSTANDYNGIYNGTLTNGATYSTGKIGGGFSFDGINDYVNLGDVMDIGLDSWSYNFWINMDTVNRYNAILTKSDHTSNWERWWFAVNDSNKLEFHLQNGQDNVTTRKYFRSTQSLSASTWYMVTVVVDRTDKAYMYINGVPETIVSTDGNSSAIANNLSSWSAYNFDRYFNCCIGAFSTGVGHFDGIIDEGGIWKRAITASEVTELYNAGAGKQYSSPPLWNGLVGYYTGDNTANDAKETYNGTLVNGVTYAPGKIGQGFSFDGINDYISTSTTSVIDCRLPHTFACWVKPAAVSSTKFFMSFGAGSNGSSIGFTNGGNFTFFAGAVNAQVNSGTNLPINTWSHVSVTYKGSPFGSNNVLFYVNGSLVYTGTLALSSYIWRLHLGSCVGGGAQLYNGMLDECGVWNRTLTAAEVAELYNSGAGKQYA